MTKSLMLCLGLALSVAAANACPEEKLSKQQEKYKEFIVSEIHERWGENVRIDISPLSLSPISVSKDDDPTLQVFAVVQSYDGPQARYFVKANVDPDRLDKFYLFQSHILCFKNKLKLDAGQSACGAYYKSPWSKEM